MSEIVSRSRNIAIGTVLLMAAVVLPSTRTNLDGDVGHRNTDALFESSCQKDSACRYPVYPHSANMPVARDIAPARAAIMARHDSDISMRLFIVGTVIEGLIGHTRPDSRGLESSTALPAVSSVQAMSAERDSRQRAGAR